MMLKLFMTIASGAIPGYVLYKGKVPGGLMIGSIIGAAALNTSTQLAYTPQLFKLLAQIVAGAYIGVSIEKSDLARLQHIIKPALVLLLGMVALNMLSGFAIYSFSPLELVTSLMATVPGGLTDIPIISEEMGADSAQVAILQFVRLVFCIGVYPSIIGKISKLKHFGGDRKVFESHTRTITTKHDPVGLALTFFVAGLAGVAGRLSRIPSATLVFPMISTIILKLTTEKANMPRFMRRAAQVLSGTYIGSRIGREEILGLKELLLPSIILVSIYALGGFFLGYVLHKRCDMPMNESMLACTPAGASDMALILADMGIESTDVIVLQTVRMIVVVSIFPQLIRLILCLIE